MSAVRILTLTYMNYFPRIFRYKSAFLQNILIRNSSVTALQSDRNTTSVGPFALYSFIMSNDSLSEINKLYKRLKEASKQANALKTEINLIRQEISSLSNSELFKSVSLSFTDIDKDQTDFYEPPLKKSKSDFVEDERGFVVVYTDGACENNGKANAKAGIGVWFGENHALNVSEPVKGKATNNTAEIQACINALKVARSQGITKVKIITDSQFTINCITKWIHNWKKNNWRLASGKGDVKNKTDLMELDKIRSTFNNIQWEHVAGHQGIRGNEEADKLAREGARRYKP